MCAWLSSRGHSYPHVPQTPLGIHETMNTLLAHTHEKKKRLLFLSLAAKASDTNQVFIPWEFAIQRKQCLFDPSFFHGGSDGWAYQNLTNALRLGRDRIVLTIIFFLLPTLFECCIPTPHSFAHGDLHENKVSVPL